MILKTQLMSLCLCVYSVEINTLSIQDFRSLSLKTIHFKTPVTILIGNNNAGKTTILESIYFCSNLKSFKTTPNQELIKKGSDCFKISLNYTNKSLKNNIFIEKSLNVSKCSVNNKKISKKDLYNIFPCYSLVFGFNNILLNDSSYRRDFLDSGLFHVEQKSYTAISNFNKTIKQRNYLLKSKNLKDLEFWNKQLIDSNLVVNEYRSNYFTVLKSELHKIISLLKDTDHNIYNDISSIDINYYNGWGSELYKNVLEENTEKDINIGYTSSGSHRSDFTIISNNTPVKESGSMSTLVLSCLLVTLAKINVFHVKHGYKPALLIDDLFFGIDDNNLNTVIKLLVSSKGNIVVTSPSIYEEILSNVDQNNKEITLMDMGVV